MVSISLIVLFTKVYFFLSMKLHSLVVPFGEGIINKLDCNQKYILIIFHFDETKLLLGNFSTNKVSISYPVLFTNINIFLIYKFG
jgi:hypothetical protein